MAKSRFVLHPLLLNRRSRFIFFIFLIISLLVGVLAWFKLESTLRQAGISLLYGPPTRNIFISIIISGYFRVGLVFATAIFAASLTAHHVVGPVKRIEQWILDSERGEYVKPLKVRIGDKFSRLTDLISKLCSPIEKN